MVFESQSTNFFKLLFVSSILADTAIISNAVLNVKCELIMPVGLLEPTNIYIVFKGLGRQILILCHLLGVHLRSTLESQTETTINQQDARITRRQECNTVDMTQRIPFFSIKKQGNDWKTSCLGKHC